MKTDTPGSLILEEASEKKPYCVSVTGAVKFLENGWFKHSSKTKFIRQRNIQIRVFQTEECKTKDPEVAGANPIGC